MTALALLQQLSDLGIVLTPYPDGTLRYKAPEGTLTSELLDGMRRHKEELHGVGEAFEERASIAEYCSGLSRPEAEVLAWACILAEPVHVGWAACGYPDVTGAHDERTHQMTQERRGYTVVRSCHGWFWASWQDLPSTTDNLRTPTHEGWTARVRAAHDAAQGGARAWGVCGGLARAGKQRLSAHE